MVTEDFIEDMASSHVPLETAGVIFDKLKAEGKIWPCAAGADCGAPEDHYR